MTYVIAEPCVDVMDQACVSVCPVDCIHFDEGMDRTLYIEPNECIDCGACEPECPVNAIFTEDSLPAEWTTTRRSTLSGTRTRTPRASSWTRPSRPDPSSHSSERPADWPGAFDSRSRGVQRAHKPGRRLDLADADRLPASLRPPRSSARWVCATSSWASAIAATIRRRSRAWRSSRGRGPARRPRPRAARDGRRPGDEMGPAELDRAALLASQPDLVIVRERRARAGRRGRCARPSARRRPFPRSSSLDPVSLEGIFHSITSIGAMTETEDEAIGCSKPCARSSARSSRRSWRATTRASRPKRVVVLEGLRPCWRAAAGFRSRCVARAAGTCSATRANPPPRPAGRRSAT